jgi:hypothetical protein
MTNQTVSPVNFNFVAKMSAAVVSAAVACSIAIGGYTTVTTGTTWDSASGVSAMGTTWDSAPAGTTGTTWDSAPATTDGTTWDSAPATTDGTTWDSAPATTDGTTWD